MNPRELFLRACALDVAVRKPGNVSWASPGHGMRAEMFVASAQAAAGPLFEAGARVGARIEAAMAATWAAVGCNTNLGILLLCAPLARAAEAAGAAPNRTDLRAALEAVLADLDVDDARAAYRAIAQANPGGLGDAPAEDVRAAPTLGLRAAMALAADRDRIACQYRNGFGDVFTLADTVPEAPPYLYGAAKTEPGPATREVVQSVYLACLSRFPDSHIVRKHGGAVAQNVMSAAQGYRSRHIGPGPLDADPAFAVWDKALKSARINPGTSADLTVATLLVAGLTAPRDGPPVMAAARRGGTERDIPLATPVVRPVK